MKMYAAIPVSVVLAGAGVIAMAGGKPGPAAGAPAAGAAAGPAGKAGAPKGQARATFAGGCFWCLETAFEGVPGVISAVSGYAGGQTKDPTYHEVSAGGTGHAESVQVTYDPGQISYGRLLEIFWHNIDPTTPDRQFCDVGSQYRAAIFYDGPEQKQAAEESLRALEKSRPFKGPIVTQVVQLNKFYPAEEYHQDFYKKDPERYHSYRLGCGRDARLRQLWGAAAGH